MGVCVRRTLAMLLVASVISACNLRAPEVTLTLVPIDTRTPEATSVRELPTLTQVIVETPTPSKTQAPTQTSEPSATQTPIPSRTATFTPTSSVTSSPTDTVAPTATDTPLPTVTDEPTLTNTPMPTDTTEPTPSHTAVPTATRTSTPLPTVTRTDTDLPTPTRILPATATPTATAVASAIPDTSEPQLADTSVPTATDQDSDLISVRFRPTFTPLPTLNQTEIAELLATPESRPTLPPTWTAAPTLPPTSIVATPDALATAQIEVSTPDVDQIFVGTPITSTPISQIGAPTPTPSPTRVQPTVAVRQDLLPPVIQPPVSDQTTFSISGASAFEYNVGLGQVFNFENIRLADGVRLFLQNPVDPSSFLRTDFKGVLRYKPIGVAQEGEMTYSPFQPGYSGPISGIEQNKNRIVELDWSTDGQQFSFRIDPPPGMDNGAAGVWFWQRHENDLRDATFQIIRDCVQEGYKPCGFVNPSTAFYWKTIGVQWSPTWGSSSILLTLHLTAEGRNALALAQAVRDSTYANNAPHMVRYDYGHWNLDGQGITVSGRRPDGLVVIAAVNNNLSGEVIKLNGSARGLWLRDAVRLSNGRYVALGRPGTPGSGPVALYDGGGNQISAFIGGAAPEEVRWFPDYSAVVVTVQGRQYRVLIDGVVTDVTGLTQNPQFSEVEIGPLPIPAGVVANSEYYPGQQLRISVPYLNVRQEPTTTSATIGGLYAGDHVAIFAGPHENEGYRWWRVQTANNVFGWIAGTIGGQPTMRPI